MRLIVVAWLLAMASSVALQAGEHPAPKQRPLVTVSTMNPSDGGLGPRSKRATPPEATLSGENSRSEVAPLVRDVSPAPSFSLGRETTILTSPTTGFGFDERPEARQGNWAWQGEASIGPSGARVKGTVEFKFQF